MASSNVILSVIKLSVSNFLYPFVPAIMSKADMGDLVAGALTPLMPQGEGSYGQVVALMAVVSAAPGSLSNIRYSAYVYGKRWLDLSHLRK